jgi:hypothetical protein
MPKNSRLHSNLAPFVNPLTERSRAPLAHVSLNNVHPTRRVADRVFDSAALMTAWRADR